MATGMEGSPVRTKGACVRKRLALGMAAMLACAGALHAAAAADLAVSVTGLKDVSGRVAVAVFSGGDGFPKDAAKAPHRAMVPIDPATRAARTVFKGLPPGDYAVAAFHDDNNSGRLETNFFGVPKKGYGFSNNARPAMRAPRFDEARFSLPEHGADIAIELAY